MKSKLFLLYEEVKRFITCWYDGTPPFIEQAESIQFLPERTAFVLQELLRAASPADTPTEEIAQIEDMNDLTDSYIQEAYKSTQKLCVIALGHHINSDMTSITMSSLTELIQTLTAALGLQDHQKSSCPIA